MKPRVKICGLTRAEDARLAARLGATHVGCVLAAASPRRVSAEQARSLFEAAGERVEHVLVFKAAELDFIRRTADIAGSRNVQLHGYTREDAERLVGDGYRVFRVHAVSADVSELPRLIPAPSEEQPAVLDVGGGGTGTAFAWRLLGERAPHATFIAGGIRPDNVGVLLGHHPYGLDLSSGVECAPGVKDPAKLERFFQRLENT